MLGIRTVLVHVLGVIALTIGALNVYEFATAGDRVMALLVASLVVGGVWEYVDVLRKENPKAVDLLVWVAIAQLAFAL